MRQLTASDLIKAAASVKPSVIKAQEYNQGLHGSASFDAGSSSRPGLIGMAQLMAALAASTSSGSVSKPVKSNGSVAAAGSNSNSGQEGTLAADAAEADVQEQQEAQRDELYRLIGKVVMGSMQ